jgi:hypothetical protein
VADKDDQEQERGTGIDLASTAKAAAIGGAAGAAAGAAIQAGRERLRERSGDEAPTPEDEGED